MIISIGILAILSSGIVGEIAEINVVLCVAINAMTANKITFDAVATIERIKFNFFGNTPNKSNTLIKQSNQCKARNR